MQKEAGSVADVEREQNQEQAAFAALRARLTPELDDALAAVAPGIWAELMEIRLRCGRQVRLRLPQREITLPLIWRREQQERQLMLFLQNSVYAYEEQLRQGFVTLAGGHRVGLVGEVWQQDGRVCGFREVSSMNIRLARAVPGAARPFMRHIVAEGRVLRTLLAAPPAVGKTTLLRDMVRLLGDGAAGLPPLNIGLADERMEIAAVYEGCPQLDVGSRCDVISACPKAQAVMLLLRSMGPQVVVTDEIGSAEDCRALAEALNAGVSVIASAHAATREELLARPWLGDLLRQGFFERVILLRRTAGGIIPARVYDAAGAVLPC